MNGCVMDASAMAAAFFHEERAKNPKNKKVLDQAVLRALGVLARDPFFAFTKTNNRNRHVPHNDQRRLRLRVRLRLRW